uniref:DUF2252 family protein n=1 Tax=Aureimonas sp. AU22 TaxID=1638162 RepID=UPI000A54C3B0
MDISAPQMTPDTDGSESGLELAAEDPEDVVLAPAEAFPRIDLRAKGEPWERRRAAGKQLRTAVPYALHAEPVSMEGRPDPIELVERSNAGRQSALVPLRMARMVESPFAFLRGAAGVMAFDLSRTPRSGIDVVMNGDAHISNFGLFGTPQRDVVLDLNDFDEVTIGPWEWDLKRLVASLNVVARQQDIGRSERRRIVASCVEGYRRSMLDLAPQGPIDVWHRAARADRLDFDGIEIDADSQATLRKAVEKARRRDNAMLLEKVGERQVDGGWRFRLDPP